MSNDDNDKRRVYIAQVSFYAPDAGPMNVIAKDEAHARELIPQLLPNFKDVKILDIVEQTNIMVPKLSSDEDGNPTPSAPTSEAVH